MPFGFLALLAAFGTLANSLRSNSASVLIRTLLRCSARPNGGGIPHGSSASRTSPEGLVRFANFARGARPRGLFAALTSRSAGASSFLTPHFSQGHGTPCHYTRPPHPSPLTPHSSLLTPHSSPLTPHSSLLTPHPSPLRPPHPAGIGTFAHRMPTFIHLEGANP